MKSTSSQSPKFAANVPDPVRTPDVVESSRLGRLEFFGGQHSLAKRRQTCWVQVSTHR